MTIENWGLGYFKKNKKNQLIINPKGRGSVQIKLEKVVDMFRSKVDFPVIVHFLDIIDAQINRISESFNKHILKMNYKGKYIYVYPIKCNQQRDVCEHIAKHRKVGFEVGSKAELIIAFSIIRYKHTKIICNGFKDRDYIRLALVVSQFSINSYIVIEHISELQIIIDESKKLNIKPRLGIRLRTASAESMWSESPHLASKFGLTISNALLVIDILKDNNLISCLELLHFHPGSQIKKLSDINNVVKEMVILYAAFIQQGLKIKTVDIGGGLAIDYASQPHASPFNVNYTVNDYSKAIIRIFKKICEKYCIREPDIISESGRYVTAHHALMITNTFFNGLPEKSATDGDYLSNSYVSRLFEIAEKPEVNTYYFKVANRIFMSRMVLLRDEEIGLVECAYIENLFLRICYKYKKNKVHKPPMSDLDSYLSGQFYSNFSVFQTTPDQLILKQKFPTLISQSRGLPKNLVIYDITCDSDGKTEIDAKSNSFIYSKKINRSDFDSLLVIFLIGAYQEALGQMHNMLGAVNAVNVVLDSNLIIKNINTKSALVNVLEYASFSKHNLLAKISKKLNCKNHHSKSSMRLFENVIKENILGTCYYKND
jgi:arginine decarboxylase